MLELGPDLSRELDRLTWKQDDPRRILESSLWAPPRKRRIPLTPLFTRLIPISTAIPAMIRWVAFFIPTVRIDIVAVGWSVPH